MCSSLESVPFETQTGAGVLYIWAGEEKWPQGDGVKQVW